MRGVLKVLKKNSKLLKVFEKALNNTYQRVHDLESLRRQVLVITRFHLLWSS